MNKNKRNLCILCLCVMLFCILFKLYSGNNLLVERYVENFELGEGTDVSLTLDDINEILTTNSGNIANTNLIPNLALTMPTNIVASYLEKSTLANNIKDTSITNDFITTSFSEIDIQKIKTQYDDDDESALKNDSYLKEVDEKINSQITDIEDIINNNNQKINTLITTLKTDIESHHTNLHNIASNDNYIRDVISGSITICDDIQHLKSFKDFKENQNIDNKINNLNNYNNLLESITLNLSSITQHRIDISEINRQIDIVVDDINSHLNALYHDYDINHCTYDPVEDASKLSAIKCKLTDLKETNNTIRDNTINDYFMSFDKNLNTANITSIEVTDLEECQTTLSVCNTLYDNINNMLRTNIAIRQSAAYPGGISNILEQHCFNLNESEGCDDYLTSIGHEPGCVVQCSVKDDQGNCLVVNEDSVNIYASLEGGTPTRIHTHPHTHGGEGWGDVIPSDGSTEGTTVMVNSEGVVNQLLNYAQLNKRSNELKNEITTLADTIRKSEFIIQGEGVLKGNEFLDEAYIYGNELDNLYKLRNDRWKILKDLINLEEDEDIKKKLKDEQNSESGEIGDLKLVFDNLYKARIKAEEEAEVTPVDQFTTIEPFVGSMYATF